MKSSQHGTQQSSENIDDQPIQEDISQEVPLIKQEEEQKSNLLTQNNNQELQQSWFAMIYANYPRSLLLNAACQYLNEGIQVMRMLAIKDIFKRHYKISPSEMQLVISFSMMAWAMRFPMGVVIDAKILSKRKYYLILFGLLATALQLIISMNYFRDLNHLSIMLFSYNFAAAFLDASITSLVVQQARKDPVNGQSDMQCHNMVFYGMGYTLGSILGAICCQYYSPFYLFQIGALITFIITLGGICLTDEVETNEYALMLSGEDRLYMEQLEEEAVNQNAITKFFSFLFFKCGIIYDNLQEPILLRFYLFLTLNGLLTPTFGQYSYFFALDILKISLFFLGIIPVFIGFFKVIFPIIYTSYIRDYSYRNIFMYGQCSYVLFNFISFCLANQWNLQFGIPNKFLYVFIAINEGIERSLLGIPLHIILAKLTPPGIESSLMALSNTILNLNQHTIRNLIGVWINKKFIGVEKENIDQYNKLVFIQLIGTLIPMLYIYCMIPTNQEINKVQQLNQLKAQKEQENDIEEITPDDKQLLKKGIPYETPTNSDSEKKEA